jgi:hypothetical protein
MIFESPFAEAKGEGYQLVYREVEVVATSGLGAN